MTTAPKRSILTGSRSGRDLIVIATTMLLGSCLLSGCLSRPSLVKQSFTLSCPTMTSSAATTTNRVLAIKRLMIAAPFDDQSLVYRTGEFSYERDPYAEFLVPPAETLAVAICGYFRDSGVFNAVTEPGSAFKPDILVEISIDQLYGDFRGRADATAVLAMRFIFFDASAGMPGKVLLQKGSSRHIHVKARNAASLVEGWNEGLKQVLDEMSANLKL